MPGTAQATKGRPRPSPQWCYKRQQNIRLAAWHPPPCTHGRWPPGPAPSACHWACTQRCAKHVPVSSEPAQARLLHPFPYTAQLQIWQPQYSRRQPRETSTETTTKQRPALHWHQAAPPPRRTSAGTRCGPGQSATRAGVGAGGPPSTAQARWSRCCGAGCTPAGQRRATPRGPSAVGV